MDEIAAAEIRKWAWEQCAFAHRRETGEAATYGALMHLADGLAAWAMSGILPATASSLAEE